MRLLYKTPDMETELLEITKPCDLILTSLKAYQEKGDEMVKLYTVLKLLPCFGHTSKLKNILKKF